MKSAINEASIDQLFRNARSQNGWKDEDVSETIIRKLYELTALGPTSVNGGPARFFFLKSSEAKERLVPYMLGNNAEKVTTAPVCAIIAHDLEFHEKLPQLFPHAPEVKNMFVGSEELRLDTAFRNGSLQGAYFIIAARAIGLDCGPISGFINEGVDKEFFPDGKIKSNFLCPIGVGDEAKVYGRLPRLPFEEACEIL